ncbi:NCS1 family nucleobase:cation symporter-1 [Nitrospirillum sp. BR 11828]|uniref:NCS1 family nucleobase:cation symporter-1 n=1 Tax=Nitrospirillum sp. BR 11828 TaxID=3104325 RepID=UPI002AC9FE77|nr:NCS1 family nucleobase:cation symporter-1 [Nitrospirillum sp. BR 11828]MDZ5649692.1 NCS1 family nucleobase:cation symporter-1 [Nitrospirillum sp. BR 11828]
MSTAADMGAGVDTSSDIWNEDLAPVDARHRTWRWVHFAALWVGMVMGIPAYMLASGLIEQGMSAWQAVGAVLVGNLIVLVPMLLVGHAGAKYGVPFAVIIRSSFGVRGNKLPALLRALIACGWFGIQCWVGGNAIYAVGNILTRGALEGPVLGWVGINAGHLVCFFIFWSLHLYFIAKGPESVRWVETLTAPLKILIVLALLWWAYDKAHGFGSLLSAPSQFGPGAPKEGQFWVVFLPSLTAMAGYWSTLAINIPDFTRFARSQRDQYVGQAIGLPLPMAGLAYIGVAVTSATVMVYGKAIWDPVDLAGRMEGIAVAIGLAIIVIDTLCVNLAANVVGPAYDFAAIFPRHVNFARGGYITAAIGIVMMPWKLIESTQGYIFTWLLGYGALLGPLLGIMLADYWLVRRTRLSMEGLFDVDGPYAYTGGWNMAALTALAVSVLPNVPGFLHVAFPSVFGGVPVFFQEIYNYAWFIGMFISTVVYTGLMRRRV